MGAIKPKDEVGGKNIKEQNTIEKKKVYSWLTLTLLFKDVVEASLWTEKTSAFPAAHQTPSVV